MDTRQNTTRTGPVGFTNAINEHSKEIANLRWIMLNMLWHSLPAEASEKWQSKQMLKAGATPEEVNKLSGN